LAQKAQKVVMDTSFTIKPRDTVFLHMGFNDKVGETPAYITDFPGLTRESAEWLGNRGIGIFGVEALSPGRPFKNNFEVHIVCREMGFTHIEGLVNLDKLVGAGRFRFIGFPLRIRGGTGSPIRAVAWLDDGGSDGHWVALAPDAVLPLDGGRITEGGDTWAADHVGQSPRALATVLYETGPYPAAVPHLYESLEQRLAAVGR
jgi:hypothetical protein